MITFRPLVAGDLPTMHRWLNDPDVVRWWEGDDVTWPGVVETYGTTAADPEEHYIAVLDGRPIGWIQCFDVGDVPEDAALFAPLHLAGRPASIDYLIGGAANRGRGLGAAMVRAFVGDVVFGRHPDWTCIVVAPRQANEASWRTLAAAGFTFVGMLEDPLGPCRAMLLERLTPAQLLGGMQG